MLTLPLPCPKQVALLFELGIKGNQGQRQVRGQEGARRVSAASKSFYASSPARKHYAARVACWEGY